jgi:hypothetical protein
MDQQLRQIEILKARGEPDHVVKPLELAWKRRNGILLPNPSRVCWDCVIPTIPEWKAKKFSEVWHKSLWNQATKSRKGPGGFLNPIGDWDASRCDLCYNQYGASTLDIANYGFWEGVGKDRLAGDNTTIFWFPGCVKSNVTHKKDEIRNIRAFTYRNPWASDPVESFEFTCFSVEYEWELRCRMPCANWTMVEGWVDPTIPHSHPFSVNIGYWEVRHYFNEHQGKDVAQAR